MNTEQIFRLWRLVLILLWVSAGSSRLSAAQPVQTGQDKKSIENRSVIIPRDTKENPSQKPERKERPDKTNPSGELKALIQQFQKARETYLDEQVNLMKQLKTANDAQRAVIRDQLKENLEQWRQWQKELLAEHRDRAQELKKELQSELGKVVDEAKGEGRGR